MKFTIQTVMSVIIAIMLFSARATAQESEIKVEQLWQSNFGINVKLFEVRFSPTDKYIIAKDLQAWYIIDPKDGKKLFGINNNILFEDGKYIRTSNNPHFIYNDTIMLLESYDKHTIEFHTVPDLKIVDSLESTDGQIITYDVSEDQKLLIANVAEQKLVLWDLETKKIIREKKIEKFIGEKQGWLNNPIFVPKHQQILCNFSHKYLVGTTPKPPYENYKNVSTGNVLNYYLDSISTSEYDYNFNVFSKDGKYLVYLQEAGEANKKHYNFHIFDFETKELVKIIETDFFGGVGNYFLTPDNKYLMLAGGWQVSNFFIYRVSDGKQIFKTYTGDCRGGNISNSGEKITISVGYLLRLFRFSETGLANNSFKSNYLTIPTPIKNNTSFNLTVSKESNIKINLTNSQGKELSTLTNQFYNIGTYTLNLNNLNLPNGLYFLNLTDNSNSISYKILILN